MVLPPVADSAFARWLASRAGQTLVDVRDDLGDADPAALAAAGHKMSYDVLLTELARWRPSDAVLTGADDPARLAADRVWIVDPLDGPEDYAAGEHRDWAVHVALWSRCAGLRSGAVALPGRHRVLGTDHPPAYPPLSLPAATGGALRLAMDPSGLPDTLVEHIGGEPVPVACPGTGIAAVVGGDADAYVRLTSSHEVQTAAPVAVATATGLYASRIDGSALEYNKADPWLPDVMVCRKDLAARLLATLRDAGPA